MNDPQAYAAQPENALDPAQDGGNEARRGINVLDVLILLAKHKLLIVGMTVGGALLAIAYALTLPNIYTSTAKIMPPQASQSAASAVLSQLSGLAGLAGGGSAAVKNPADLYVGMLKSRTVADRLISRFELQAQYGSDSMVLTRNALAGHANITAGKDGLITVEFDDRDPKLAAAIANGFVEELDNLTQSLAVTEPAQRRLFFERQLQQSRENLMKAQIAARSALEKGGVAMVDEQGKSMIESIAKLRAQITLKEVQINSMKGFANEQNAELVQARQELAAVQQQLAKLEGSGAASGVPTGMRDSAQGLKNFALVRDVKYNEALFELFAKQYEIAKIDEAKEAAIVQVIDQALPPDRKSKPKRALIVIGVTFSALMVSLLLALLLEARQRARRAPAYAEQVAALRHHLSLR